MSTSAYIPIQQFRSTRIIITLVVSLLIVGMVVWEHFHGGVPSHHILQQKDLPEISNWWGGLLLPILTWILTGRVQTRIEKQVAQNQKLDNLTISTIGFFSTGLLLAILIVISFLNNYEPFLDNVPYIFLLLGLIVPIYYAEFILGFILGMAYTFGAILPTVFILILAGIGCLIYRYLRPLILKLTHTLTKITKP